MIKKSISVLLAVVMILSIFTVLPVTADAATSGDFMYTVLDDGTARIKGYKGTGSDVSIPSVLDGYTVTSIGMDAFINCWRFTSISIPSSVTDIWSGAFSGCTRLTSVSIPSSVTWIGQSAFRDCTSLTSVNIPSSITSIGNAAFYGCTSLTNIKVDKDNKVYDSRNNCNAIIETSSNTLIAGCSATVILPSVTKIGYDAFDGCSSLTSVTIPSSVTSIDFQAFGGCTSLTSITIPSSVTFIESCAFSGCTSLKSVNIPSSVTSIQGSVFSGCTSLMSVNIPNSVTSIGSYAFEDCTNLMSISIPSSVTKIGVGVFGDCTNLASVTIPSSVTLIEDRAFQNCTNLTSVIIPSSVTRIGESAFHNCTSLTSVTIPSSVTFIKDCAFQGCTSLTSIHVDEANKFYDSRENCNAIIETSTNKLISGCCSTVIPSSVTSIGNYAFHDCKNLKSIAIPSSVTSIGLYAFSGCTSITSVMIPSSVTSTNEGMFSFCESLKDVYYEGSEEDWQKYFNIYSIICGDNLIYATIHYNSYDPANPILPDDPIVPGMYCDGKKINGIDVNFDDSWFFEDSKTYNHELAQLSSQMLLEGYIAETDDEDRKDGKHGVATDLESSLKSIGFDDKNIKIDLHTGRDQMNYFIASRTVASGEESSTLVYVGCIGSYHEQWNSNFDPNGKDSNSYYSDVDKHNHKGFDDAKNYIYAVLTDYIDKKGLTRSNTKILLTGHSRGAATANLLAAKLLNEKKYVYPSNLFTYTFASPNCTNNKNRTSSDYDRIFNIVLPTDFVTKVLPSAWDYGRYGTTFVLPTKTNSSTYESTLKKQMLAKYNILNQATQGNTVFHDYGLGEAEVYHVVKVFTASVGGLFAYYYLPDLNGGVYFTPFQYFQFGLCPMVNKTSNKYGNKMTATAFMLAPLSPASKSILYKTLSGFFIVNQGLSPKFADAHKMETYCAFMLGLSKRDATRYRTGYKGSVNCPVDVEIIDKSTGEVVGRIVDNVVDEAIAAKENSVVMTVDGDQKEYWLPSDGDYEVRLTGNDSGVMDYTLSEVDSDLGETERKNFFDVPLEKDVTYVSTAAENPDPEAEPEITDFTLTDENDEEVTPDEAFSADEAIEYTVTPSVEGSGSAEPVTVKSGDYASVSASPVRSEFIGWYQGDTLLSEEETYRFRPTEDTTLTAKFTVMTPLLLGDADGDDNIMILDTTGILRNLADIMTTTFFEEAADVDDDGEITVMDATLIQLYLAQIVVNDKIGKPIDSATDSPENFEYQVSDGSAIITKYTGNKAKVHIPSRLDGYAVTGIGNKAFYNTDVAEVDIPDSVTNIGEHAFSFCSNLKSITIPRSVTRIDNSAFYHSGLTEVFIPDTVTNIGEHAFSFCSDLKSITIPRSVTRIENSTFYHSGLTEVFIPDTVKNIGEHAFSFCSDLKSITIPNSVTRISKDTFYYSGLESIYIPKTVKNIDEAAFYFCNALNDVYYGGSEAEWDTIGIENKNEKLTNATIHYHSTKNE